MNENHDNNILRRTRNTVQYMTTASSEEKEDKVHPKYQSNSCHSYKCEGVLTSEIKIVTTILKWLMNLVTDLKKT
jgi:hypothetical protein